MTATKQQMPLFESNRVSKASVRITRAGDGLSEALSIGPQAIQLGQEVYYVLRGVCTQVNHTEKDDVITRVHTITAENIVEVEHEIAEKILQAAAEDLARRKDEADGQLRLDEEHAAMEREAAEREAARKAEPPAPTPIRAGKARAARAAKAT